MTKRVPNPYRPGFNQQPTVFAGRGDVLDGAREALAVAALDARTPRPIILVGPRGVGKTVTLGEISDLAATDHSWPTVHVEATGVGLLDDLAGRLGQVARLLDGQVTRTEGSSRGDILGRQGARITGGKVEAKAFGIGGSLDISAGSQAAPSLDQALSAVMELAVDKDAGVVVTLDELQNANAEELHRLGGVLQEAVPRHWPLVVVIAALPSLRRTRHKQLPTYLERAEWHELGMLSPTAAREALTEPAAQSGRPMDAAAADLLLRLAGSYPYAIQVAGHFAWRASTGSATITSEHVAAAQTHIRADLTQLFKGRWDDASPREREYLASVARLTLARGAAPHGGQVAADLGKPVQEVSYLRERLLKKGTLYRDAASGLHFITPGMTEWVAQIET